MVKFYVSHETSLAREALLFTGRSEFFVAVNIMFSVYLLENNNDKSWYIGQTNNLKRRLEEHNSKQGGRTTKIKEGGWKLIYAEAYLERTDALGRERFLKSGSGYRYLKKQLKNYLNK